MKRKILVMFFVMVAFFSVINVSNSKVLGVQTIDNIVITTNLSDMRPVQGKRKQTPTAFISNSNVKTSSSGCYWMKKNGSSWQYYSTATFSQGVFKYHFRFEVSDSVASLPNPVTVTLDGRTSKVETLHSSGVYYFSIDSEEFEATKNEVFTATATVTPEGTGKVYYGSRPYESAGTSTFTYAENKTDLGTFTCFANPGYVFKEWRLGSPNGSPVTITEEQIKASREEVDKNKWLDPDVYIDSKDTVHFKLTQGYKLYAVFERDTNPSRKLKGDLNLDDLVNSTDAAIALDIYKGSHPITEVSMILGDMNGDNIINSTDAAMILDAFKLGVNTFVTI